MSDRKSKANKVQSKQFIFYFPYTGNSIDIQKITDEQLESCLKIYNHCSKPYSKSSDLVLQEYRSN